MKKINLLFIVIASLTTLDAMASAEGVPTKFILTQLGNFVVIIAALAFFTRKTIKKFFEEKSEAYLELVNQAQKAKELAQTQYDDIKNKLVELETTAKQNFERIKNEAGEMKQKMINDANTSAERIKEEANKTSFIQFEKAKRELRQEMLELSLVQAEDALKKNVDGQGQKKLQTEFVEKIQVVR